MTSSYDIPTKYKTYVGRVFILRKYKQIPGSRSKIAGKREYFNRKETFGDACMVLDETNSKVKVTCLGKKFLWIPKYFLHKELQNSCLKTIDVITELTNKLVNEQPLKQNEVEAIASILRSHADELKKPLF